MPEQEIVPDTRTTGADPDSALVSAEALVTVVVGPEPPPVVPPFCDAQPTRPVAGGVVGCVVGVVPLPTFTSSHCWLYWFFSVSCVMVAPSAVDRSVTVTALPLFLLTSRTRPPSESTSLNCWLAALASVYCRISPPSAVLQPHTSSTLPECRFCSRYQPEPESRNLNCCQFPSLRVHCCMMPPSAVEKSRTSSAFPLWRLTST